MQPILDALQNLPVNAILDALMLHTETGVAIVNSEPASGKTLLIPTMLHLLTGEQVLIIEPRRSIASNAAETLADLSHTTVGEYIGYAIGMRGRSDDEVTGNWNRNGLMFTTYGYALATMRILEADIIVLDEIHENTIDIAVCKALIKRRMASQRPLKRLVLLSATLDAQTELDYWKEFEPKVFSIPPAARYTCDFQWQRASTPAVATLDLIARGAKGVLVFVEGANEIAAVHKELDHLRNAAPAGLPPMEVSTIQGFSSYEERKAAFLAPPPGVTKVLIGTNVLESGINIPWVDAGVSSGSHKEQTVYRESGAIRLNTVPISRSNLDQQVGRTNRFQDSRFILCGHLNRDSMYLTSLPEINRLPLTALYMHCSGVNVDPNLLEFSPQPGRQAMEEAATALQYLGFLDAELKLTDDGRFAQDLPVGLSAAALLCHAEKIGLLAEALPLAAIIDHGSIRQNLNVPHYQNDMSDPFDEVFAFEKIRAIPSGDWETAREEMERCNVHKRRFNAARDILRVLEKSLGVKADPTIYQLDHYDPRRSGLLCLLRQCILAASLDRLGSWCPVVVRGQREITLHGNSTISYSKSNGSAVHLPSAITPLTATLRSITPRNGDATFTIAENITQFDLADFRAFALVRPGVFRFDKDEHYETISVFGKVFFQLRVHQESYYRPLLRSLVDATAPNLSDLLRTETSKQAPVLHRAPPVVVSAPKPLHKHPDTPTMSASLAVTPPDKAKPRYANRATTQSLTELAAIYKQRQQS